MHARGQARPEHVGMARPEAGAVGERHGASALVIARCSRPISAWRSALGDEIDHHDGRDDQQQDRRHVGIVELADRLDQVLADAAGADEAHDRGAAHVDLEAQQRVGGEIRQHLRQRRRSGSSATRFAPVAVAPSTGFMSMFSTTSANSLPSAPMVWMASASTPGIGPRPNATTNSSANTISGTVRQNSRKRRLSTAHPASAARDWRWPRKAQHESRRGARAPCRDRRSASVSTEQLRASLSRFQNHSRGRPRGSPRSASDDAVRCSSEADGCCAASLARSTSPAIAASRDAGDSRTARAERRRAAAWRRRRRDRRACAHRASCCGRKDG